MSEKNKLHYLKAMGVQVWELKESENMPKTVVRKKRVAKKTAENIIYPDHDQKPIEELTWDELKARVAECTRCDLYKTRTRTVFGVGNRHADLLIIGEAPGANEDKQGEPFVGRAGKLLNLMLQAIELNREEVFITNVVKSRPPENRDPKLEEIAACTPYLIRQIALIQPKLILALGKIAAQFLLNTNETMAKLRGQEFTYGPYKTPLLVTYHPAYLLRAPKDKRKAWEDLQLVSHRLQQLQKKA